MKALLSLLFAILAVVSFVSPAKAQSADQRAIQAVIAGSVAAIESKNVTKIMSYYENSPNLVAFDAVPPLRYVGWQAYKKDFQGFFAAYKGPIRDRVLAMEVGIEGSMAYSYDIERVSGTLTNGTKSTVTFRITDVYRKIAGRWLIVHEHVSVPVDLTTGKAVFNAKL